MTNAVKTCILHRGFNDCKPKYTFHCHIWGAGHETQYANEKNGWKQGAGDMPSDTF